MRTASQITGDFYKALRNGALAKELGAGLGKEFGDAAAADNRWDWYDVAADAVGVVLGVAWCAMFYYCKG